MDSENGVDDADELGAHSAGEHSAWARTMHGRSSQTGGAASDREGRAPHSGRLPGSLPVADVRQHVHSSASPRAPHHDEP